MWGDSAPQGQSLRLVLWVSECGQSLSNFVWVRKELALASTPVVHLTDCGSQLSPAEPGHGLRILSAAL